MANRYLIDIGMNDHLQDVIRKCNQNFRLVSNDYTRDSIRSYADIDQTIQNIVADFEEALANEIQARIDADSDLAPLNEDGIIDPIYLPSYVDDVIEVYPRSTAPELSIGWLSTDPDGSVVVVPERGKIYIMLASSQTYGTNTQLRWSGSQYVPILDPSGQQIVDYDDLIDKPTITEYIDINRQTMQSVVIQGDHNFDELGMKRITNSEIESLLSAADLE